MADEKVELISPVDETEDDGLLSLVDRLEQLSKGAKAVELATVAGAVVEKGGISLKPTEVEADVEDPESRKDPLRKNFETLASFHRDFKHFGSQPALDDPVTYLHDTVVDIKGRRKYRVSDSQLEDAIQMLLEAGKNGKTDGAETVGKWADRHHQSSAVGQAFQAGLGKGAFGGGSTRNALSKALETGGGSTSGGPLIRVDIDPLLREAYLRKFPLYDMIRKFPANGLVHTFNQRTAAGTAALVDELGSLSATESASTYGRQATSHIGVLAAQRQISLKLQYAVAQSGMSFDLTGGGNLEVMGALTEIARLDQTLICQGNYSTAGKVANDEEGLYNVLGFDGFRNILKGGSSSMNKAAADSYLRTINRAVADIINSGGDVDNLVILCSLYARMDIEDELLNFLRVMNTTPGGGFPTNLASNGILTVADTVSKLMPIPAAAQAEGLGYYDYSGNATEELIVTDPSGWGMAYLGSPTPVILELPVGFNNALSNVYIPFVMHGLTVFVVPFNRKIRIARVTS